MWEADNLKAIDIEKEITVSSEGTQVAEWLELGNGCICCSVKDTGVAAIESLMSRSGLFDYILLETTGLADPGNIAPLFWLDDGLGSSIYLDGIVTLVDASNILRQLEEQPTIDDATPSSESVDGNITTAHLQISHADVLIINKSDLVTPEQLERVKERVRGINALAKLVVTERGVANHIDAVAARIPGSEFDGWLLNLHAYDEVDTAAFERMATKTQGNSVDPSISTVSIPIPRAVNKHEMEKLEEWFRSVLWENTVPASSEQQEAKVEVHRLKGRVVREDGTVIVVQGVREVFEVREKEGAAKGDGEGKVVLIGKGLKDVDLQVSLWGMMGMGRK